ncbi:MAG: thioredoxin domain-containing protein [Deltaproteobacteria bacterium]|nr:thioredoxin domain-containing protein [Deltaproteobacteria bacterium]
MKAFVLILVLFSLFPVVSHAEVLATVNDKQITSEEVDGRARQRMIKILSQMYDIKRDVIEDMIDQHLLEEAAKKEGKKLVTLRKEIMNKVATVTEAEAQAFYQMQKNRFKGKGFEEVKNDLVAQITAQKRQMALNNYLDDLRKNAKIKVNLERPRVEVSTDDDPSKGPKGAPITIVEFSEYQCPFCKRARPTIDRILKDYEGKVHYVFRDFPLSFHKQAKDAANAAHCAGDQGKYWEYSEMLWASQGKHSTEKLKSIGQDLKLNQEQFEKCMSSNKYYAEIDKDQRQGSSYGVSGTPAYFINGMFLSGAQPFEAFKELIDEELNK